MRKIRMGMVGGGSGAFIGAVHRVAAQMDGEIELVCGAFNSDAKKSRESGRALYIDEGRCYDDYAQMFVRESQLNEDERMDFVSVVTPNHLHFPVAKMAIEHGFHVLSDKPATLSLAEAKELKNVLENSTSLYGLTHTYTGYPMVKEARARVAAGELGKVKKVVVEYSQGWLASADAESNKQAEWRLDPARAGISCCMGDIGVHAANLAEYICRTRISEVCSLLESSYEHRQLDDDGTVMLRFDDGAHGVLLASQISVGEENNLRIRVYGELASLDWSQQEPNTLWLRYQDKPANMLRAGVGEFSAGALHSMRTPAGHPEGYLEAFANIYRNFAEWQTSSDSFGEAFDAPGIDDAIRGMAFIEAVVAANKSDMKWHPVYLEADLVSLTAELDSTHN